MRLPIRLTTHPLRAGTRLTGSCSIIGRGHVGVYSSAFVVMARSVGIPARVVSGWMIVKAPGAKQCIRTGGPGDGGGV